jgi:hypothetical protein
MLLSHCQENLNSYMYEYNTGTRSKFVTLYSRKADGMDFQYLGLKYMQLSSRNTEWALKCGKRCIAKMLQNKIHLSVPTLIHTHTRSTSVTHSRYHISCHINTGTQVQVRVTFQENHVFIRCLLHDRVCPKILGNCRQDNMRCKAIHYICNSHLSSFWHLLPHVTFVSLRSISLFQTAVVSVPVLCSAGLSPYLSLEAGYDEWDGS